jgi:hypothetical protein
MCSSAGKALDVSRTFENAGFKKKTIRTRMKLFKEHKIKAYF